MVGGGPLLEDRLDKDGHVSVGRPKSSHNGETEVVLAPSDNGVNNKARVYVHSNGKYDPPPHGRCHMGERNGKRRKRPKGENIHAESVREE